MPKAQRPNQRRFYCYVLCDPSKPGHYDYGPKMRFTCEPFYVGKGSRSRAFHHLYPSVLRRDNTFKAKKIRKLLGQGITPKVVLTRNRGTEAQAFSLEQRLIATIGTRGRRTGPLTNLTAGGDGTSGLRRSRRSRSRTSASISDVWASRSARERAQISRKSGAGVRKSWQRKTQEDIDRRAAKKRATWEAKPPLQCPHCGLESRRHRFLAKNHFENCPSLKVPKEERVRREILAHLKASGDSSALNAFLREECRLTALARPEVTCPECGFVGKGPAMKRWHFDNCRG